jgi:hypothetical protein
MDTESEIERKMNEYPFTLWFIDSIPISELHSNRKHFNVWFALALIGTTSNGGLLSVFEDGWGRMQITDIPDVMRDIGSVQLALLIEEAISLFPKSVVNDVDLRRNLLTSNSKNARHINNEIERIGKLLANTIDNLDSVVCTYIISNISEFHEHRKWLTNYLNKRP